MAILQSTDQLEDLIGNKYSLVIVSAKRARQLKEGHSPLAQDASPNPLSIALREIEEHAVACMAPPEEDLAPAPRDVITSLVTAADLELDEDLDLEDSDAVDDLAALLVGADDEEEETESEDGLAAGAEESDDADEADADESLEDDAEEEEEATDDEEEE
jgi:DNA-directed RNA polymerase subunit omega